MTARTNPIHLLARWALLALPLLAAGAEPPATAEGNAAAEALRAGLCAWQESLRAELAAMPAAPGAATPAEEPCAADPAVVLEDIRRLLDEWRVAWKRIDEWEAERPLPVGRAAELVALAQACALERRHHRDLRERIAALGRNLARLDEARRRKVAEDLRRVGAILEDMETADGIEKARAALGGWIGTLENAPATAPATDGKAPAAAELRARIASLMAAILEPPAAEAPAEPRTDGGRAQDLLADSKAYPAERQRRLDVMAAMRSLAAEVETWLLAEHAEHAARRHRLADLANRSAAIPPQALPEKPDPDLAVAAYDDPEAFEYYEMKQAATLREVSAMPGIYGDPDRWRRLLDANPAAASAPTAVLPVGTLLIVPRDKPKRD